MLHRLSSEEYEKKKQQEIKDRLTFYYGPRDEKFTNILKNVLLKSNLKPKYLDILLTKEALEMYNRVFTSNTINSKFDEITGKVVEDVNSNDNYEVYEKLGDGVFQNFIAWYAFRLLGQDRRVVQVKIYAGMKSKYGSREEFAPVAESLGFWPYISASIYSRTHKKKALLEDVFEAFIGATSYYLDEKIRYGVGYAICYDILSSIMSSIKIETEFEELQDYVSKLNEFSHKNKQYVFEYESEKFDKLTTTSIYRIMQDGSKIKMGEGSAANKSNSKKAAAENVYKDLERRGIIKS